MFVPIESAFVEALKYQSDTASDRKEYFVATPTTLLTSLNIVKQLWRLKSKQNTQRIGRPC